MAARCWAPGRFPASASLGRHLQTPRLLAVQAEPYTPIYDAFHNHWAEIRPALHMRTIAADGITISHPVRWGCLLEAINFLKAQ